MSSKLDAIVERYVALRDEKAARKKQYDADVELIENGMERIENFLLARLNELGVDSIKAGGLTALKTKKTSATVEDWDAVLNHIKANEAWNMLDKKVNKTAVVEFKEVHKALPPGVMWREEAVVQVRR